ncbi:MAG: PQQ-dependent sugar dehydrogenase [Deltaproteobacteria bacterium]|nr:PQQ-dependent sugar dehydrogenase [Deltaproteobacteria bacterium]
MSRLQSMKPVLCAILLLTASLAAQAQSTGNPIATSAPVAPWSLVLEDVVTIPDSSGAPPRLEFLTSNGTTGLAYVIDQRGFIYSFDPAAASPVATLFLDLGTAVGNLETRNESGVRGLAFHPDFDNVGTSGYRKMYTSLSRTSSSTPVGSPAPVVFDSPGSTNHYSVIAEWTLFAGGSVDTGSYRELIRIEQPYGNHNSLYLGFDPTAAPASAEYGKLFISVGDGGNSGDPFDMSQDIDETPEPYPHGKILRIDPNASGGLPYSIPSDNPFAGVADRVEEIWAYGMRNPHKFTWDTSTGLMYVSDIGQGVVEEISVVRKEANLGWNEREGAYVFVNHSNVSPLSAGHASDVYTYPVAQYDHSGNSITGSSAIVGASVYRGSNVSQLTGMYFFADFATNPGPIFAVHVMDLVERDDFSGIAALDDGRLAPFVEVKIHDGGVDKDFRQFLRDANSDPGLSRTDTRWGVGPSGEIFVLNKHDGVVRRISGVVGFPEPPKVPLLATLGLVLLAASLVGIGLLTSRRLNAV